LKGINQTAQIERMPFHSVVESRLILDTEDFGE